MEFLSPFFCKQQITVPMKKLNSLQDLGCLNQIEYKGKNSNYQQKGNTINGEKVNSNVYNPYNKYQNLLYRRALFGLKAYTEKEIKKMHKQKRERIVNIHKKAQTSLNIMKQERINNMTNSFFNFWFPKCAITKSILEMTSTDKSFFNTMQLKDIGIDKEHVINRFIDDGILPKDFHNISKTKHETKVETL
jgi:hypothetical protein